MQMNRISTGTPILLSWFILWVGAAAPIGAAEKSGPSWEVRDKDRIVLLGNTFIERENNYPMIELSLRLAFPDLDFSVRNLGWSGDNVWGESRAYFGTVEQGYAHILEYVKLNDPTLLIVSYGQNAAFAGEAGLDVFLKKYASLLDDLQSRNRRIVVLGPTPAEAVILSQQEAEEINRNRKIYSDAIESLCASKQIAFVEMLERMQQLKKKLHLAQLTTNGVHFNQLGYAVAGEAIINSLGKSLVENDQLLLTDSQFQAVSKPLLQGILKKNELFFYRFRPQNETYLRGFRKHEQGQNAKEIYEFDALVAEQEKKLAPLTKAVRKAWWK